MKIKTYIYRTDTVVIAPGGLSQSWALVLNPFPGKSFTIKNLLWQVDLGIQAGGLRSPVPLAQNDIVWYDTRVLNRIDNAGIVNEIDLATRVQPLAAVTTDTELVLPHPGQFDLSINLKNYFVINTNTINTGMVAVTLYHSYAIQIQQSDE